MLAMLKQSAVRAFELTAGIAISVTVLYPMWQQYNKPEPDQLTQVLDQVAKANKSAPVINENNVADLEFNAVKSKADFLQQRLDETSKHIDHIMNNLAIDAVRDGTVVFSGNIVKATVPAQGETYTYTFNFSSGVPQEICYSAQGDCKKSPELDKSQQAALLRAACGQAAKQKYTIFSALNCQ